MKYAVIGMGFIYPRHKQSIEATGGQVVLTCDIDSSKNPDFTDWVEMFHSDKFNEVDAVVICTPNYLHGVIAREARLRNKLVLSEKPLCIDTLEGLEEVKTVLQLRHHPKLKGLHPFNVSVTAKMFRDQSYWNGWKGNKNKSGGVLYNLGIHYIDLLIYLLGKPLVILESQHNDRLATGKVRFEKGMGEYHIEILDNREGQIRKILVDGNEISLSDKDNLSYEDLHTEVYKNFIKGEGVPLGEARKSLQLVQDLLKFNE